MSIEITDHFKSQIEEASREATKNILSSMSSLFEENKLFDVTDKNSKEYIVASSLSHLKDAWSYFGQSINAILKNDTPLSKHFSYYSELRSALSLMATEGIAIYNNEHYYIDQYENVQQFTRSSGDINELGTHKMVWVSMDTWSMLPKSRELLEKIIHIEGKSLKEWVEACDYTKWCGLSYEIYKNIGIDLKYIAHDREMRNSVSYSPTDTFMRTCSIESNAEFILKLWDLLEPNFKKTDFSILKKSISLIGCEDPSYAIDTLIENDSLKEAIKEHLSEQENVVFEKSSIVHENLNDALNDPENHLQMLGRAFLLLRVATGSVKLLLKDANIEFSDIAFWSEKILDEYGLVKDKKELDLYSDMWVDVEEGAIQPINDNGTNIDFFTLKQELSYPFLLLSETQRPLLWGIEY